MTTQHTKSNPLIIQIIFPAWTGQIPSKRKFTLPSVKSIFTNSFQFHSAYTIVREKFQFTIGYKTSMRVTTFVYIKLQKWSAILCLEPRVNSLFGRVCKLVLSTTVITLLYAWVLPQCANSIHILSFKCGHSFIVHLSNHVPVFLQIIYHIG